MNGGAGDFGFFNIAVGDGNNVASETIFDFGRANTSPNDGARITINRDVVADFKVIFRKNRDAADNILECVLNSKANCDRGDSDAGEKTRYINAKLREQD